MFWGHVDWGRLYWDHVNWFCTLQVTVFADDCEWWLGRFIVCLREWLVLEHLGRCYMGRCFMGRFYLGRFYLGRSLFASHGVSSRS